MLRAMIPVFLILISIPLWYVYGCCFLSSSGSIKSMTESATGSFEIMQAIVNLCFLTFVLPHICQTCTQIIHLDLICILVSADNIKQDIPHFLLIQTRILLCGTCNTRPQNIPEYIYVGSNHEGCACSEKR